MIAAHVHCQETVLQNTLCGCQGMVRGQPTGESFMCLSVVNVTGVARQLSADFFFSWMQQRLFVPLSRRLFCGALCVVL